MKHQNIETNEMGIFSRYTLCINKAITGTADSVYAGSFPAGQTTLALVRNL